MNNTKKNKFLRTAAKPLLAIFASLVTIILCDLVFGMAGLVPQVKPIWVSKENAEKSAYQKSKNPILGFELKPNYRNPNADFNQSYPYINSHGFRDIERKKNKNPDDNVKRVLLLGDSVVEGLGIREIDQNINRQMELLQESKDDKGPRYEVLNMGISGYCTRAEIELLKEKGLEFHPDYVVLVFVENDFDNFVPPGHSMENIYERPGWVKNLFLYSNIFRLMSLKFNWYHFGEESDPLKWNRKAIGNNNVLDGLKLFHELAEENDFTPIIVIWPRMTESGIVDRHPISSDDSKGDGELIIERLARDNQIPSARLSPYFESEYESLSRNNPTPRQLYSTGDEMHPSPKGASVAAKAILEILDQLNNGKIASGPIPTDAEKQEMLTAIENVGDKKPGYAITHTNEGKAFLDKGELDKAEEKFRLALKENPEYPEALFNYGVLQMNRNENLKAIEMFRKLLEIRPYFKNANMNLAISYIKSGKPQLAPDHFAKEIELTPDNQQAYYNYSILLTNTKNFEKAEHILQKSLGISSNNPNIWNQLGIIKLHQSQWTEAVKYFEEVLKLDPNNAIAVKNIKYAKEQLAGAN